jgi:predicted nucleic acid-binding protein
MLMLDTQHLCLYLKKHPLYLLDKFNQLEEIHLSTIVYSELCSGVSLSPEHLQAVRQQQLQEFIGLTYMHSWDEKAAVVYAQIRAYLKVRGILLGTWIC